MWLIVVFLVLILLGLFTGFLINRAIWPAWREKDGRRAALARMLAGASVVLGSWVVCGFLYQLEPFTMVPIKDTFTRDLTFFIGLLFFPSLYMFGAELERLAQRSGFPPLDKPIILPEDESIIVIADTHLGLRPNPIADLFDIGSDCDLHAIGTFIDWLVEETGTVPEGGPLGDEVEGEAQVDETDEAFREDERRGKGTRIQWWDENDKVNPIKEKWLKRPRYVVLLGDILEMWDGWNESVQLAVATTFSKFNRVDPETEVVYVVGNHDQVHTRDRTPDLHTRDKKPEELYVEKDMMVAADSWPGPKKPWGNWMQPITAGNDQYLFVHGHQFDWGNLFAAPLMQLPGLFRRAAQLGYYYWFLLLLVAAMVWFRGHFEDIVAAEVTFWALLIFLLVPIGWITLARIVYSFRHGVRYREDRGLKHFPTWWRRAAGGSTTLDNGIRQLSLVYGHTHTMDIVNKDDEGLRIMKKGKRTERRRYPWIAKLGERYIMPQLINVPSWIRDRRKSMDRAIFLYIDGKHHLFLGWDWKAKRPYHIPDGIIRERRGHEEVGYDPSVIDLTDDILLDELNWPPEFRMYGVRWGEHRGT